VTSDRRRFEDCVVVVTGGASGIGEATVHRFASEGGTVVLVDVDEANAKRVAGDTSGEGGRVEVCVGDVATNEGWAEVVGLLRRDHDGRVDVVVNNATSPEVGPLLGISESGWERTFNTNVGAVWRSAKATVPLMQAGDGGVFVNISSNAALAAIPGLGAYGAAKAAIIALTRQLALELAGDRIRANSITPGVIRSPGIQAMLAWHGRQRVEEALLTGTGDPDELARVILFLASQDAAYVNGENITVDGGWYATQHLGGLVFGPAPDAG
jgi:NAD(P)-dependent dehydrogenase (short-subunit alcohol dehydrogenase family)